MKTLPIQKLPADRMAALTQQGARELRAERIAQVQAQWHDQDRGPGGGCAVALLPLSVALYVAGWAVIHFCF